MKKSGGILPVVVAITGASGSMYGIRLVETLARLKRPVYLMISDPARIVMETETPHTRTQLQSEKYLSHLFSPSILTYVTAFYYKDVSAAPASGSHKTAGMIVAPCSGATLSAIAHGTGRDLIERAAEVTMKEGRRLILMPRETPLSAIYIENMLKLARVGVHILPAAPAFYTKPKQLSDLWDFMVGRALDLLDIEHRLYRRWNKTKEKV